MTLPFGCPEGTMFAPFDNRGSCDVGRSQGRAAARPPPGVGPATGRGPGGRGVGAGECTRRDRVRGSRLRGGVGGGGSGGQDRKSTRLNSSHSQISYAVF